MKRATLIITVMVFVAAAMLGQARAAGSSTASRGLGLGVIVGEPTGLSLKVHLTRRNALAFGAAWSFRHNDGEFHLHGDYLFQSWDMIDVTEGDLAAYVGVGGRIRFAKKGADDTISVRVPLGLDYYFQNNPIDIFVEVVPVIDLAPDTDFDLMGALGVRFNF